MNPKWAGRESLLLTVSGTKKPKIARVQTFLSPLSQSEGSARSGPVESLGMRVCKASHTRMATARGTSWRHYQEALPEWIIQYYREMKKRMYVSLRIVRTSGTRAIVQWEGICLVVATPGRLLSPISDPP